MADHDKKIPKYMAGQKGRGTENIGPVDAAWVGEDGELDPDILLQEHGYDPDLPLEWILLAIIDAHPSTVDRSARLRKALNALVGPKRGRPKIDDHDLLLRISAAVSLQSDMMLKLFSFEVERQKSPESNVRKVML